MGKEDKEYTWNLIAKKLSGEASPEELRELEMVLRRNPELHYPMQTLMDLWHNAGPGRQAAAEHAFNRHLDRMAGLNISYSADAPQTARRRSSGTRRTVLFSSIIAVALGVCMLSLYSGHTKQPLYLNPSVGVPGPVLNEVATANGSRTHLVLPDGTKVWLNAGSRLTYDKNYGSTRREINLAGEAFFDVARDPHKPFIIHAARIDIRVLGTSFNVRSYTADKTTEATLVHGSIAVSIKDRPNETIILKPNEKLVVANDDSVLLRRQPGQHSAAIPTDSSLVTIRQPSYEKNTGDMIETSWVENKLSFQDEDFGALAKDMERWFGVSIRFTDPRQATWRFTGTFEKETIREALDAMKITTNFNYTVQGNQIEITTNK